MNQSRTKQDTEEQDRIQKDKQDTEGQNKIQKNRKQKQDKNETTNLLSLLLLQRKTRKQM